MAMITRRKLIASAAAGLLLPHRSRAPSPFLGLLAQEWGGIAKSRNAAAQKIQQPQPLQGRPAEPPYRDTLPAPIADKPSCRALKYKTNAQRG
jgi:hypothetical protein